MALNLATIDPGHDGRWTTSARLRSTLYHRRERRWTALARLGRTGQNHCCDIQCLGSTPQREAEPGLEHAQPCLGSTPQRGAEPGLEHAQPCLGSTPQRGAQPSRCVPIGIKHCPGAPRHCYTTTSLRYGNSRGRFGTGQPLAFPTRPSCGLASWRPVRPPLPEATRLPRGQ
jgi:hypothetical protein